MIRINLIPHIKQCLLTTLFFFIAPLEAQTLENKQGIYFQAFSATQYTPFLQDHFNSVWDVNGAFSGFGVAVGYEYIGSVGFSAGLNLSTSKAGQLQQTRGPDQVTFNNIRHTILTVDIGLHIPLAAHRVIVHGIFGMGLSISSYDYHNSHNTGFVSSPLILVKDPDGPNAEGFFRGGAATGVRVFVWDNLALLIEYRTVWAKITAGAEATSEPNVYLVDYSKGESFYTDVFSIGISYTIPWKIISD